MPTPVFCCGFECGIATSGAHFSINGTSSFSTSTVRSGARSGRINPTAANFSYFQNTTNTGGTVGVLRWYVRFASLPLASTMIGGWDISTQHEGVGFNSVDSKLYPCTSNAGVATFGSTGFTITTGVWYRIDLRIDVSANPHTIDVQVDGTSLTQLTRAVAASGLSNIDIGFPHTVVVTADMFVDDVWFSKTSADFPYGAGKVEHAVPTSDGTHNVAGAADFRKTLTGVDITNATTDAYTLVDNIPLDSGLAASGGQFVNMVLPPNATDYVECVFGPAPGIPVFTTAPRAVEVIATIAQAGTGTGNMEIRMNDNGTTNAMYSATTVAGVTTYAYKRKHYATAIAGGGAWVIGGGGNGDFTDLRVRFGSPAAVDANPDQYFSSIMIEAEFAEVVAFSAALQAMHRNIEQPYFNKTLIVSSGQKNNIRIP